MMGIITWSLHRFLQAYRFVWRFICFLQIRPHTKQPLVPPAMCGTTRKQLPSPSQRDEPRLEHKRDRNPRVEEIPCTYVVVSCTAFRRLPHIKSSTKQATHHRTSTTTTTGFPWSPPHPPAPPPVTTPAAAAAATALLPPAISHAIKNAKCKCASHTQKGVPRSIKGGEPKKHRPVPP